MHVLTAKTPIKLGHLGDIPAGRYLVEDLNAAELLVMSERGTASLGEVTPPLFEFDERLDWNGRRILFARSGGYGDLLFLGPVLREVRRRWPTCTIAVACRQARRAVLGGLSLVDVWEETPITNTRARAYDAFVSFEHAIETERREHYVDALAIHMGLTLPDGPAARRCEYRVTADETRWARAAYPRVQTGPTTHRRVGVQWSASARARSYPPQLLAEVCSTLERRGWEVFVFGEPGGVPAKSHGHIRIVANDERLTFRQSCAALTTCDVVLAPDSALLHVAAALRIPAVGLFGPIDGAMRCKYSPTVTVIQGPAPCAPCHFHQRHALEFPSGGPCQKSGRCDALAAIDPGRVVADVEALGPK